MIAPPMAPKLRPNGHCAPSIATRSSILASRLVHKVEKKKLKIKESDQKACRLRDGEPHAVADILKGEMVHNLMVTMTSPTVLPETDSDDLLHRAAISVSTMTIGAGWIVVEMMTTTDHDQTDLGHRMVTTIIIHHPRMNIVTEMTTEAEAIRTIETITLDYHDQGRRLDSMETRGGHHPCLENLPHLFHWRRDLRHLVISINHKIKSRVHPPRQNVVVQRAKLVVVERLPSRCHLLVKVPGIEEGRELRFLSIKRSEVVFLV